MREVGEKLGLSKTSVHRVLNKDLSMNKVYMGMAAILNFKRYYFLAKFCTTNI